MSVKIQMFSASVFLGKECKCFRSISKTNFVEIIESAVGGKEIGRLCVILCIIDSIQYSSNSPEHHHNYLSYLLDKSFQITEAKDFFRNKTQELIDEAKYLLSTIAPANFLADSRNPSINDTPVLHAICHCAMIFPVFLELVEHMMVSSNLMEIIKSQEYLNYRKQTILTIVKNYTIVVNYSYNQFSLEQKEKIQTLLVSLEQKTKKEN